MTNDQTVTQALEFIDKFFEPWGSWKTAWWEGEVSDDAAFSADNALKHVANILRRTAHSGEGQGWIVGNADGTKWRCWGSTGPEWTDDHEQAIRYARRIDAERTHADDDDAWRIVPYSGEGRSNGAENDWIAHDGGDCPVNPAATVEIKLRDGSVTTMTAKAVNWRYGTYIFEVHCTMPAFCEVVAYRIAALSALQGDGDGRGCSAMAEDHLI